MFKDILKIIGWGLLILASIPAILVCAIFVIIFFVMTFPWSLIVLLCWPSKSEVEYEANKRYVAKHMADELRKNK